MSETIQRVSWQETESMNELFEATWTNVEPGFQIEDVHCAEELQLVFAAMQATRPSTLPIFDINHAYVSKGDSPAEGAHTDSDMFRGLAVHQNIEQSLPLEIGVSKVGQCATDDREHVSPFKAHRIKRGATEPGLLTVFSEGKERAGLQPTVHLFKRDESTGSGLQRHWVRYAHMRRIDRIMTLITFGPRKMSVDEAAEYAFKQLD